jgi:hypothetical protein
MKNTCERKTRLVVIPLLSGQETSSARPLTINSNVLPGTSASHGINAYSACVSGNDVFFFAAACTSLNRYVGIGGPAAWAEELLAAALVRRLFLFPWPWRPLLDSTLDDILRVYF